MLGSLLGDGMYQQQMAAQGLPLTLTWVNTSVTSFSVRLCTWDWSCSLGKEYGRVH